MAPRQLLRLFGDGWDIFGVYDDQGSERTHKKQEKKKCPAQIAVYVYNNTEFVLRKNNGVE